LRATRRWREGQRQVYLVGEAVLVNDKQRELLAAYDAPAMADAALWPLVLFARRLLRERDLDGCYFPPRHFALVLARSPSEEMAYRPRLTIRSSGHGEDVRLDLKVCTEIAPIVRWVTETAICLPDRAMSEFDRLYEKLLKADRMRPSGGEVLPPAAMDRPDGMLL
jgi:hypothetical protein